MGFKRTITPREQDSDERVIAALAGLGMAFAGPALPDQNIEDALLAASVIGMEHDDYRVLGVIVVWLDRHRERLNADRMIRLVQAHSAARTRIFWQAMAQRWATDRRWLRLAPDSSTRTELLRVGNDFQCRRHGEDPRFATTCLIVPQGVLRDRASDAETPAEVAQRHRAYRYRVQIGPSYRADLWAALEAEPNLTPSELAQRTYASFATAWQVKRDFATLKTG